MSGSFLSDSPSRSLRLIQITARLDRDPIAARIAVTRPCDDIVILDEGISGADHRLVVLGDVGVSRSCGDAPGGDVAVSRFHDDVVVADVGVTRPDKAALTPVDGGNVVVKVVGKG